MASADFCGRTAHVALTLHVPCLHQSRYCRLEDRPQTSPVNGNNFHPMWPLDLPADLAVGLCHISQTHPVNRPCIQFLFVGSGLCRRASFTRPLAWPHLPSASGSASWQYRSHSGLSPPSYCPCWANEKEATPPLSRACPGVLIPFIFARW